MAKYFSAAKMGLEDEDWCSDSEPESDVTANEIYKQPKITYTRDFLLPFAELDVCKGLPCGFDSSNLRAFNDACDDVLQRKSKCALDEACSGPVQRQRTNGDASLLGIRGSEQGSSLYNRDSEFTRQCSNQYQFRWHDGLLGSGFQRVPGYTTGNSAPSDRGNDKCLLKRSDAPYRPPHSYKALPHSRRENNDLYNVESIGSTECLSEEGQDKERRRKEYFELMRKEQQKATQGKHKAEMQEQDCDPDDPSFLEDSRKMLVNENRESVPPPVQNNETAKKIHPIQSDASGPLFSTNPTISEEHVAREDYMENENLISFSSNLDLWFLEEDKKLAVGASCGDEKCGSQVHKVSNGRSTGHDHPNFSSNRNDVVAKPIISPKTSATYGMSGKPDPTVRTCLEQSILADSTRSSSSQHQSVQGWSVYGTENGKPKNYADDEGESQHLLSMVQKGERLDDLAYYSERNMDSSDKINLFCFQNASSVPNNSSRNIENSKKNLPLREIFGACVTPELQSIEASFSIQRRSVGRIIINHNVDPYTVPPSAAGNNFFPSTVDKCRSIGTIGERIPSTVDKCRSIGTIGESILPSNRAKETELVDIGEHGLGFDDVWANARFHSQIDQDSKLNPVIGFKNKVDFTDEICLPEEDSLITIDDILAHLHPMNIPAKDSVHADFLNSRPPACMAGRLEAHYDVPSNGRLIVSELEDLPFIQGSCDVTGSETSYLNFHEQKSNPKKFHSQMNPGTQFFCPLYSYQTQKSCQIKSRNPEISDHNPVLPHHLPQNERPRPFQITHNEPTRFDRPVHRSQSEPMQLAGNFPHQLSGRSKGTTLHPTDLAFCRRDLNPMQSFPLNYQQPSYAGLGMQELDFGVGGNNNQAAYNRQVEMKLGAKQTHAFPIGGHR